MVLRRITTWEVKLPVIFQSQPLPVNKINLSASDFRCPQGVGKLLALPCTDCLTRALLTCMEDGLICSVFDLKTCEIRDSFEVYIKTAVTCRSLSNRPF